MGEWMIEVMGGPMDGLACELSSRVSIGRNVGNTLSIAFDKLASGRHAEIRVQGSDWCLRDLNSTNGTYYGDQRLDFNTHIPLQEGKPVLVGATIIRMLPASQSMGVSVITKEMLKDPREIYSMSQELQAVWEELFAAMTDMGDFCDVGKFAQMLVGQSHDPGIQSVVAAMAGPVAYGLLGSWLPSMFSFTPDYNLIPGYMTVAPRLRKVLDLAQEAAGGNDIEPGHFLHAVQKEGKSLIALHLKANPQYLRMLNSAWPLNSVAIPDHDSSKSIHGEEKIVPQQNVPASVSVPEQRGADMDDFKAFVLGLEKLINGFLADAKVPRSGWKTDCLPGFDMNLSEIWDQEEKNLERKYLDNMYKSLAAVLAAYQDSYSDYGRQLCGRLEDSMDDTKDYGARSKGRQKTANTIHATLARLESEGLGEEIVRAKIRENISKFGLG